MLSYYYLFLRTCFILKKTFCHVLFFILNFFICMTFRLTNTSLNMVPTFQFSLYDLSDKMWHIEHVGSLGCGLLRILVVEGVEMLGMGMLVISDVGDMGCWGSEMLGMWDAGDVGC